MTDVHLTFLLMGKTGQGKSRTGNSLLDRKAAFVVSGNTTSETKEVKISYAEIDNYRLMVVDGPGLDDTDMTKAADRKTAAANMANAVGMCNGGVDAFLLVTKYGCRFTEEERSALDALKQMFGKDYMNHVIVVVTNGDTFEDDEDITFEDWCRKQTGAFRQLYADCKGRVVLVNNSEKDEGKKRHQRDKMLQLTLNLKRLNGQYTSASFKAAKAARDKMIVEAKAPELGQKIQEQASLLAAAIEHLPEKPSDIEREKILRRIQKLRDEIIKQDMGTGVLDDWKKLVAKLESHLNDAVELRLLAEELETIRQRRNKTSYLGTILMGIFSAIFPPLAIGAAVSGVKTTRTRQELDEQEAEKKRRQQELKGKLN